ncbi:pirin family protein [Spirochaeta isovalerica]|uniref:Pirin domain protein n=1 Tax=Spirochaeta isovalerica TaxID=150 RepID=A0A841R6H3_9SPIO|nr:pirin family protein [Spirochaeta isovalerica]MBB6479436.1 hypothetical protein [Spirochaeta isovalerica]
MKEIISNLKPLDFHWKTYDPFLFCAHHYDHFPKGNDQQGPDASLRDRLMGNDFTIKDGWRMYHGRNVPGFPVHPHRGFETVTIVLEGFVDHSDSLGAGGRYGQGDVQWMTAGSGIQHSEMFPCIFKDKPNTLHLFQVWLNLPRKSKFVEPYYRMFWNEDIPVLQEIDERGNKTSIRIIAGSLNEEKALSPPPDSWASDPANNVAIWIITIEPGARWNLPENTSGAERALYYYKGKGLKTGDTDIPENHSFTTESESSLCLENTDSENESCLLLLQGIPLNEPVVQSGPFVMNTEDEIYQTYSDYRETQFGGWPWDSPEPVHGLETFRFARFADGRIEKRD